VDTCKTVKVHLRTFKRDESSLRDVADNMNAKHADVTRRSRGEPSEAGTTGGGSTGQGDPDAVQGESLPAATQEAEAPRLRNLRAPAGIRNRGGSEPVTK